MRSADCGVRNDGGEAHFTRFLPANGGLGMPQAQPSPGPHSALRTPHSALSRLALTRRLVALLADGEAVIGGIGNTKFDLVAAGHRAENFYMLGSMGLSVPIALGVALAQPERRVIALEGD